jgi:hypothetical protein
MLSIHASAARSGFLLICIDGVGISSRIDYRGSKGFVMHAAADASCSNANTVIVNAMGGGDYVSRLRWFVQLLFHYAYPIR